MKIGRKTFPCEVPSVAMGDIAFNLMIFFVILAKAQDDSHVRWQAAVTEELKEAGNPRASVAIDIEGKLYLNGQPIGVSQLEGRLNDILGSASGDDRKVQLKVHKETQALLFQPVLEAISRAGAKFVHILEEQKPPDQ